MTDIRRADVDEFVFEGIAANSFYADASDLGFPVNKWPTALSTDMGNHMDFVLQPLSPDVDGDISKVMYIQPETRLLLVVYNT